jgi:hypothetical protein
VVTRPAAVAAAAVVLLPLTVMLLVLGTAGGGSAVPQPAAAAAAAVTGGAVAGGTSAAANEAAGARLASAYGWAGVQVTCLDELWTRESGWSQTAKNPSSGAYGISQALGHLGGEDQGQPGAVDLALNLAGDNYPPADAPGNPPPYGDSDPDAQISWGLSYIQGTYGTPCQAWVHEETDGFY